MSIVIHVALCVQAETIRPGTMEDHQVRLARMLVNVSHPVLEQVVVALGMARAEVEDELLRNQRVISRLQEQLQGQSHLSSADGNGSEYERGFEAAMSRALDLIEDLLTREGVA